MNARAQFSRRAGDKRGNREVSVARLHRGLLMTRGLTYSGLSFPSPPFLKMPIRSGAIP